MTVLQTAGLSHSEISGSMVICTYPKLIAAYHVLHRLREPRHPPCALSYFLHASAKQFIPMAGDAHTFSCIRDRSLLLYFCLTYSFMYQYVKDRSGMARYWRDAECGE